MKNLMAVLLAFTTVLTLSPVALANVEEPEIYIASNSSYYVSDREGHPILREGATLEGNVTAEPGRMLYIPLDGTVDLTKAEVKKYKVFTDWIVGSTEPAQIVYEQTYTRADGADNDEEDADERHLNKEGYQYLVAIRVPSTTPDKAVDLCGTVRVARSSTSAKKLDSTYTVRLNMTAEYQEVSGRSSDYMIKNNDAPVIDFDEDGVVEIVWGQDDDLACFEVDVTDQEKLDLSFDTKYNKTIAQKYDFANLDFVSFLARPSFNKYGTLYIYGDKERYLYEITPEGDLRTRDYVYDNSYGAFRLRTRTLGHYVLSDKKLGGNALGSGVTTSQLQKGSSSSGVSINGTSGLGSSVSVVLQSSSYQNPGLKYNPDTGVRVAVL